MQTIVVGTDGTKNYKQNTVVRGLALPTKATRERSPEKVKYSFNGMVQNDVLFFPDRKALNAATQAFKNKVYEAVNTKGKLVTRDLRKLDKSVLENLGWTEGYGAWYQEFTADELAEMAAEVKA